MAETINGLYKAEVIWRREPWRSMEAIEYATQERVDWLGVSVILWARRIKQSIGLVSSWPV